MKCLIENLKKTYIVDLVTKRGINSFYIFLANGIMIPNTWHS